MNTIFAAVLLLVGCLSAIVGIAARDAPAVFLGWGYVVIACLVAFFL